MTCYRDVSAEALARPARAPAAPKPTPASQRCLLRPSIGLSVYQRAVLALLGRSRGKEGSATGLTRAGSGGNRGRALGGVVGGNAQDRAQGLAVGGAGDTRQSTPRALPLSSRSCRRGLGSVGWKSYPTLPAIGCSWSCRVKGALRPCFRSTERWSCSDEPGARPLTRPKKRVGSYGPVRCRNSAGRGAVSPEWYGCP